MLLVQSSVHTVWSRLFSSSSYTANIRNTASSHFISDHRNKSTNVIKDEMFLSVGGGGVPLPLDGVQTHQTRPSHRKTRCLQPSPHEAALPSGGCSHDDHVRPRPIVITSSRVEHILPRRKSGRKNKYRFAMAGKQKGSSSL